jgi:hybrid polyketide synthase / nonribosomal peptide synthetase ACE1
MFIAESNLNMLSPTGKSRMWDADADGYARGEGVACVIMKRLSDAVADGDHIECLIRETGINQDGRTPGITMPSSSAQAALIRQTYAKAGLDPCKKADRCQYFEAHGTGTKVGDPREAGAIYEAFFDDLDYEEASDPDNLLHVGSIKTVIGHTEGTAGIAGLLKASLAVQNRTIPPNMLFNSLNPDIEPFYDHLKIPTAPIEWPSLENGTPRRASVNSFGFGGTNAHAIIEHYEPQDVAPKSSTSEVAIPFVFSATSEKSLTAQIKTHLEYLMDNPQINLTSVASTLAKRSAFNFRTSFSGTSIQTLCEKMNQKVQDKDSQNTAIGTRAITKARGILGVFTGQGAQWAAMGRELILSSLAAEAIIDDLERSLANLPAADRPTWSLKKEILALAPESRIAEGLMSQPLCTALQIVLVDLLRTAGITFEAVVGHSSGEIGAAYAAGYIAASDAIRIAYYRGLYAKLAKGPNGEDGSMLAVGTSFEDANDLCQLRKLRGKLQVAASNSSASVTLSGNLDAAEVAVDILQDEGKFVRQLKVDTAYHSRHMEPCGDTYVNALKACDIELLTPPDEGCRWYSSVFAGRRMDDECEELKDVYWRDNMLKPVFFAQALAEALEDGDLPALVVEVGPHPALKGPATRKYMRLKFFTTPMSSSCILGPLYSLKTQFFSFEA